MPSLLGGRYQITKVLGQGGFGTTYLAEDTHSSNLICVIKQLNPNTADIETAKRLFQREAEVLNQLQSNQQVPRFYNYFEEGDNCYLVQEYVRGETLDKLTQKPWTQYKIVIFLWEILSILEPLHEKNIIHRDIKPANLMQRDKDRKLVLIDFGAVKQISSSNQPQIPETRIITLGYSPPEQEIGVPGLNSDIYALGMTAIQLLTNISPRNLQRDLDGNLLWNTGINVSSILADILNKMVCLYSIDRYQSVEEILRDLNQIEDLTSIQTSQTQQNSGTSQQSLTVTTLGSILQFKPRLKLKRWHIPAALVALSIVLVGVELIFPFARPWWYVSQGNQLLDARQPDAAIDRFQQAIDIRANSGEAWKGKGDALLSKKLYIGAIDAYDRALSFQPNNIKALTNKGKALYQQREYDKAIEAYQAALKIDPNDVEVLSSQGIAYYGKGENQKALDIFDRVKKLKSNNPDVWYQIGFTIEGQNPEEAKNYYEQALYEYDDRLKKQKTDLLLWSGRGNVLLKLQKYQEALDSYEEALKIDGSFYEALLGKGNALEKLGKLPEALEAVKLAQRINPGDSLIWYTKGVILAKLGNLDEAVKSFDGAINLRSDYLEALLEKGFVLTEQKKYAEAVSAFERAKKIQPNNPLIWAEIANVLDKSGNPQAALDTYDRAIQIDEPFKSLPPKVFQERNRLRQKLRR